MKILFRADSSSLIGLGHIMRDLVLAKRYPNCEIHFACQELKGNINNQIPYPVHILTSNKPEELIKVINSLHVDTLIIDHYDINKKAEKNIKEKTGVKILCFDDDYREHFCDEIINHNISADISRYKNASIVKLIPPLIREEFQREKKVQREKLYDIFLAMGGSDSANLNITILKSLPAHLHVAVLTTSSNANLKSLIEYTKDKTNISLHVNSKEVAKLLNQSKFAITTPSGTIHEVLFMEIPFIAIQIADNQKDMSCFLEQKGYNIVYSIDSLKLLIDKML